MTIKTKLETQELVEITLKIQLTLLVGMQVKDIIRVSIRMMQDHFILLIMKVMAVSKRKRIEKNNG